MMLPKNDDVEGLPASEPCEMAILGASMVDPIALADACSTLRAEDFAYDSHQRIFRAIIGLSKTGRNVDTITVREALQRKKELDSIGGVGYLFSLANDIPRNFNIESYVRIVKDKARLRRIMSLSHDAATRASDQSELSQEILDALIEALRMLQEEDNDFDLEPVGHYAEVDQGEHSVDAMADTRGIKTGFSRLDSDLAMGMQPGELIVVAARPSAGKTAWACTVAHTVAVRNGQVAILFALEQSRRQMKRRMLSSATRIDLKEIRSGELRATDLAILNEERARINAAELYIDDSADMTVTRIRAKVAKLIRRLKAEGKGDLEILVMIDQLSFVSHADLPPRLDFRLKVGLQTKALKRDIAKAFGVPVIVFNQLGRESAKRSDPTPQLPDLKESGNLEEDADMVLFLHRPEYYDKKDESLKGKAQIILAKQRDGETGTIHCAYDGRCVRWEDTETVAAKQSAFVDHSSEQAYKYDYSDDRDRIKW